MSVSMRDISKAAGVSITTVSNVLRRKGRVSEATRRRILAVAKELGYFRGQRRTTGQLGVIYYAPPHEKGGSYYTTEAISAIQEVVSKRDYQLSFYIVDDPHTEVPPMVEHGGIEGLLVIGGSISDSLLEKLTAWELPLVLLYSEHPTLNLNCVLTDNQKGAYLAVQHLYKLGHKKIGFINGWSHTHTSAAKLAGYRQALSEGGLPFEPALYTEGDFTVEGGAQQMAKLLCQNPDLTSVFVADDLMAIGAMHKAQALGRAIPEDLAIVGFGDSPFSAHTQPPLSTIRVEERLIGTLGAQRLLSLIDSPDEPPLKILTPTKLIPRKSSGC